jgi:hypothetical protein
LTGKVTIQEESGNPSRIGINRQHGLPNQRFSRRLFAAAEAHVREKETKILKITLAALLGVEAVWVLASLAIRTRDQGWHYPLLHGVLFVGLPLALLGSVILQVTRPGFALLLLAVLFPPACFVTVMSFLPFRKLVSHVPRPWQGPAAIVQNAVVVLASLTIRPATGIEIHNQTLEASPPQPKG